MKPVIPDDRTSAKYKTEIDVLNKHFTGILVLKQTDDSTKHLVFVTELGMRMFDFVIRRNTISPEFVFDALNKPKFITALTSSFRDILLIGCYNNLAEEKQNKNGLFYWVKDSQNSIAIWKDNANFATDLKVFSGKKKSSVTRYYNNYGTINYKRFGVVKLKITLSIITS